MHDCRRDTGEDGRVSGVRVTGIQPGSRFERLGLKRNDVVVRCGGAEVGGLQDLARYALRGAGLDLKVRREGSAGAAEIELGGT